MLLAVLIMGAMGVVGYVAAWGGLGLDGKYLRAFLMVVMFSNGGNYGLPVVTFVFGPEALTYATIFFLTGSLMTCVAGAFFAGEPAWENWPLGPRATPCPDASRDSSVKRRQT